MLQTGWKMVRGLPSCSLRPLASAAGDARVKGQLCKPPSAPSPRKSRLFEDRGLSSSTAAAAAVAPSVAPADQGLDTEADAIPQSRSINVLNRYRALLLDNTYRPVGVANWQRYPNHPAPGMLCSAICLDLLDKADVLEYYDHSVRSVQLEYYLPAVLRVRRHRSVPRHASAVTLNRANVMLRDQYACQYCGSSKDLTIDHVVPQSKGGGNTWENLVACCASCNSKKGNKSLEQLRWKLRKQPKEPSMHEMDFLLAMLLGSASQDQLPPEWQAYIVPFAGRSGTKKKKSVS